MKIILSEKQFIFLMEQPDSKMPFQPEKYGYKQNKPQTVKPALQGQSKAITDFKNMDPDTAVDIVSGLLAGIPGIGTAASFILDVGHVLSYMFRFGTTDEEEKKIEFFLLALLTFGMMFLPGFGDAQTIIARGGIKQVLKLTPAEILKIAQKLGLSKETTILLQKGKWKYSILMLLVRMLGNETSNFISQSVENLKKLKSNVEKNRRYKFYSSYIQMMINLLKELESDVELVEKLVGQFKKEKVF